MSNGTPITALTPRTTGGAPINVANASPTVDTLLNPATATVAAATPAVNTNAFQVLSAENYGMPADTKLKLVYSFQLTGLAAGKPAKVTFVSDGNEKFTNTYLGSGWFTLTVEDPEMIGFGKNVYITFKYDGYDFEAKTARAVLIATTGNE